MTDQEQPEATQLPHHYHGDSVRTLFIIAALIMVLGLAFVVQNTTVPYSVSIVCILILGVSAGTTSQRIWSALLNAGVALVALLMFETYSVREYSVNGLTGFFWLNELLSFIFLLALYFGIRTLRWLLQTKNQ